MRLNHFILLFSVLLLTSCDKREVLCSCQGQDFSIQFVDAEGNDLIENGTYGSNKIIISKNGFNSNTFYNEMSKRFSFHLEGEEGDNIYKIIFNNLDVDTLILNLSQKGEAGCCGPTFTINSAHYNDIEIEIVRGESDIYDNGIVIVN